MKPLIYINPIRILKTPYYYPLWKRHVVYPKYNIGDPQLFIPLVPFWMKMVHIDGHHPKDLLKFKVHPQMTDHEVTEYLSKIYDTKPMTVKVKMIYNDLKPLQSKKLNKIEAIRNVMPFQCKPLPERYEKVAYVRLFPNHEFKFPNIFEEKQPEAIPDKEMPKTKDNGGWFNFK